MKILKSLALVAGLAFVTTGVSAQSEGRGNVDPQTMAQNMTNRVKQNVTGITADQETQILAAEKDFATGMQTAKSNSNGDKDAMHSQMETLKSTRDTKIKSILTADQYAQYQKMETSHQDGHKGGN
jgi:periplasmic protein CpxP/Spy